MEFIKNNVVPYDLAEIDLNPEQKKKRVGIITELLTADDVGTEYHKLIKSRHMNIVLQIKRLTVFSLI